MYINNIYQFGQDKCYETQILISKLYFGIPVLDFTQIGHMIPLYK